MVLARVLEVVRSAKEQWDNGLWTIDYGQWTMDVPRRKNVHKASKKSELSLSRNPPVLRKFLVILCVFSSLLTFSQVTPNGVLTGNVVDEQNKALIGASVDIFPINDSLSKRTIVTDKEGAFSFQQLGHGYYQLRISYVGLQPLRIDSIYFRAERMEFNLADLMLKMKSESNLEAVIVYAEKPLIETKDGNIIFNASESPLSAGSTANELLSSVPLVTKDGDGKISVRGKEPKILIDDKPVQLNLQQLQDLLESMPGSSIEKIEVMTNPPPQYANEQGGVINIVTKKGKVGRTGRVSVSGGTRGEASLNASYTYRKQGFSMSATGGAGYSYFSGEGYSIRENIYKDSTNHFNTRSNNRSKSLRPNFRLNMDYDLGKFQSVNVVAQFNSSDYNNNTLTEYTNLNRFGEIYRLSERAIGNEGDNYNASLSLSYLLKTKKFGEQLRIILDANASDINSDRDYYQQFFNPDHTPNGVDSTQEQLGKNWNTGYNARINYDRPLIGQKTFLSIGSYVNRNNSEVDVDASYLKKPDNVYMPLDKLSNHFIFHQTVTNFRAGLRQVIGRDMSISGGISAEQTQIWFELIKENRDARNQYWTWLPYASINKRWQQQWSLALAYRRSIRRPGVNELNPTIDFSDPYNIRFGNPLLEASTADNFDLVLAKTQKLYFINLGLGYNDVKDIFSRVRTLLPDGKTQTTWENISGRKEYEISTWGGLTIAKKWRANISANYTYNKYSQFDRTVNHYRNGGSFTSTLNSTFTPKDILNFTAGFNFNRFASPQGYARWNWSMNAGAQKKFLQKRLTVTLNIIDPFIQQQTRVYTYGSNFNLESYNETNTRNFRLTLGYTLTKPVKSSVGKPKV